MLVTELTVPPPPTSNYGKGMGDHKWGSRLPGPQDSLDRVEMKKLGGHSWTVLSKCLWRGHAAYLGPRIVLHLQGH